jgi:2-(1,2-epoxy-1,2-dihydrophenyl)acetyl-CoA isomerase
MMAFANIGLTPDRGVSYLLPRVVGLRRALDFTLNRRVLTADEALRWSLVNAIADDQAEAAVHVARKISDGPLSLSAKRVACCERPIT